MLSISDNKFEIECQCLNAIILATQENRDQKDGSWRLTQTEK
jgi:hypothetical protein